MQVKRIVTVYATSNYVTGTYTSRIRTEFPDASYLTPSEHDVQSSCNIMAYLSGYVGQNSDTIVNFIMVPVE